MSAEPASAADLVARLRASGSVFAEDEARLLREGARSPEELAHLADLRVAGAPLEQVLGWVEFCGRRMVVEPGVFVPRRRTELLVSEALAALPPAAVVVDLCCGAGAVGAVLAADADCAEVHAVDVDPAAVHCARRNAAGRLEVHEGDLYDPLPRRLRGRVDVLVANAPYVPASEMGMLPPEARDHEPEVALSGGQDGLDVVRRIVASAAGWLAPGGRLLVESSRQQEVAAVGLLDQAGLLARVVHSEELSGVVVIGSDQRDRPGTPGSAVRR